MTLLREERMLTKSKLALTETVSDFRQVNAEIRQYRNPEARLKMTETERNNVSMSITLMSVLLSFPPFLFVLYLTPVLSKLMEIPIGASLLSGPVIPLVIAVTLLSIFIIQKFMRLELKFGFLLFTFMVFTGSYFGWFLYLIKLQIAADAGILG